MAGDDCLAQREAAVVGGDAVVDENFEAAVAQQTHRMREKAKILKCSAAEADPFQSGRLAQALAGIEHDMSHREVESRGDFADVGAGHAFADDGFNHGARIDLKWFSILDGVRVRL